jgi:hypothetical protein
MPRHSHKITKKAHVIGRTVLVGGVSVLLIKLESAACPCGLVSLRSSGGSGTYRMAMPDMGVLGGRCLT